MKDKLPPDYYFYIAPYPKHRFFSPTKFSTSTPKTKKGRRIAAPPSSQTSLLLGSLQILRRELALLASLNLVTNFLALFEGAKVRALNSRNMHEHIFGTVVGLNETITLRSVKPLHCT